MTEIIEAEAWTADWLVGWLASVGITYRDRSIHLSWSDGVVPCARFHVNEPEQLDAVLPTVDEVEQLVIARTLEGFAELKRNPSREAFVERASRARSTGDLSLGATISDIGVADGDSLPHSPFDAAVPKGITLGERAATCAGEANGSTLTESFAGVGRTSTTNGLGFDLRRRAAASVPGKDSILTDPVAETLALYGILALSQVGEDTRGWAEGSQYSDGAFRWPAWVPPLDWCGIDALLDDFFQNSHRRCREISARFQSTAYRPTGSSDRTRGYDGYASP